MSAEKIKKFFSRKKEEAKFKLTGGLGQGRTLKAGPESSSSNKKNTKDIYQPPKRKALSEEAKTAAAAAMNRVQKKDNREFNTSLAAIKAQVKRELEAEKQMKEVVKNEMQGTSEIENKNLACQGVYFRCALVSSEILPKKDWKLKIKEFLYQQLVDEKGLTACLILQNCNIKEKAEECIETLKKYIDNLINHPNEEKYHKIRMTNKIFCDKVRYVEGALEFLQAAGFKEQKIDNDDFLVWSFENMEGETDLTVLMDALDNAEPLTLELDRNIQVLLPSQARKQELPADFFRISPEEIKREQQLRTEALENAQILKTKAMRDREELRALNKYRYALIRIKFPDGIFLQGTFNVYEKMADVYEFVQSCIFDESIDFNLIVPVGGFRFSEEDMDKSLFDLRLIPNTVLMFLSDTMRQNGDHFLKEHLLMLIQEI